MVERGRVVSRKGTVWYSEVQSGQTRVERGRVR